MGLFGGKGGGNSAKGDTARMPRFSSGWSAMLQHLRASEGLRVLDFGPTSAGNINLLTQMGHSIYMANLAEEANRPEWVLPADPEEKGAPVRYNVDAFLQQTMDFSGRRFDVVLLWDTLDYLPAAIAPGIVDRLTDVVDPGGKLLGLFHAKLTGPETAFSRYHLTNTDQLELQRSGSLPVLQTWSNRQVEQLFHGWSNWKFYLAKDALREATVTR